MSAGSATDALNLRFKRENTAEQVAGALRDLIVEGRIPPGTHLREGPLSTQLGVSRNTVREATQILIGQGLANREIHRGAYVIQPTIEDVHDLFRTRRLVELAAAREAALTHKGVEELQAAVDGLEAALASGDMARVSSADLVCHRTLVDLVHGGRLAALFGSVEAESRLCLSMTGGAGADSDRLLADHRALLDALAEGDTERAVAVLDEHLADSELRLVTHLTSS
ncbi:GntR family transcriptional regulator [Streptomyces sp. NBC_00063]|uniref:GntR family transcriptional regulator n=1 Tax=Streptomyces sp. NBC_00063 TaxID=2975638 RepID=UPI003D760404